MSVDVAAWAARLVAARAEMLALVASGHMDAADVTDANVAEWAADDDPTWLAWLALGQPKPAPQTDFDDEPSWPV